MGAEGKFEDRNSNITSSSRTEKLQQACMRFQGTDALLEDFSFLETEKAQQRGG